MISAAMSRRAQELADQGVVFATATVVRAQRPTSVTAGDVALVLGDGTMEGFVGGECTEHSVRTYALKSMQTGEAVLLRILPFDEKDGGTADDLTGADGSVTVQNPCLSGGAIEVFLEPVLPAARVLVVGDTPIARALVRVGGELGFAVAAADGEHLDPHPGDLALVVAAHGRDELHTLRLGLEAALPYVGLVASPKRGTGVLAELRADGVPDAQLARIDVPAGLDIGARTPGEVARLDPRRHRRRATPASRRSIPGTFVAWAGEDRGAAAGRRPDLRHDRRCRRLDAVVGAQRRDRLLLLRRVQGQVRGAGAA